MKYIKRFNESILSNLKSKSKLFLINILGKLTNQEEKSAEINKIRDMLERINHKGLYFNQIFNVVSYLSFELVKLRYKTLFPNNDLKQDINLLIDHYLEKMRDAKRGNSIHGENELSTEEQYDILANGVLILNYFKEYIETPEDELEKLIDKK